MSISFLSHIEEIEDSRVPGMTKYPLEEVLLTVLTGLLCRCEDRDEIEAMRRLEGSKRGQDAYFIRLCA